MFELRVLEWSSTDAITDGIVVRTVNTRVGITVFKNCDVAGERIVDDIIVESEAQLAGIGLATVFGSQAMELSRGLRWV